MTILLYLSAFFLAGLSLVAAYNFLTAPLLRKLPREYTPDDTMPSLTVLVPARNEERNMRSLLDSLLAQDYPNMRITVLDDQSEDGTARIVEEYAASFARVRLLRGRPLPPGWIGKAWACMQLGNSAEGDILLFTDADTKHERFAVSHTVAWMQHYRSGMFSAFSQQRTVSMLEKMVIPFIDMLAYALLPMRLVYSTSFPSIAGANGQWIAFTRDAYQAIGGHSAVKNTIVEDIELSRVMKRRGIKTMTAAGTGAVYCRMYHSSREVWEGFSKNFYAIAGNNFFLFAAGIAFFVLAFLTPYVLLPFYPSVAVLALIGANMAFRAALSLRYKHPLWTSIVLHPFGVTASIVTALYSFVRMRSNRIVWKDRNIDIAALKAAGNQP